MSPVSPPTKSTAVANSTPGHRPGRPKDIAKREAIIKAARSLFTSQPFDIVTMEAVAKRARVSKMTVYSHFHDKETLFETVILAASDQMIAALSAPEHDGALRERLTGLGKVLLDMVLGSEICTVKHALPAVLRANRPLAERFYAAGPGRVRAAIGAIIEEAAGRGELDVDAPDLAAEDLISLWEGGMPARIAFGLDEPISPEEVARRAERGTTIFLRAYRYG